MFQILGIDQYGQTYKINKYPRKELIELLCSNNVSKMYCDTKKGETKHIGYIINNLWITLHNISQWNKQ